MNKPISIKMQETTLEIVNIINKSQLPPFCIKTIINNIFQEVDNAEKQEIQKYQEYIKEDNKDKKKGSGK